ncbi:replication initiation protein [Burkholderia oklahomensis]|uniref:replication initiation protein n=1 Tax=Burkholderia oklahomensis TaxID=342113 RepID=UPI00016A9417|nr:replication initiation protein [Burkholderia oklahomensis]AJX33052.1 hypothetical protein BG90_2047 [Burkholderia oklahomensis C6786]AOI44805.1 hypothetical protein WI23_02715 [Burkholderia oklahomensis C6786]KUY65271.1 hypothetical protein WI23_04285 [Burkholderia oklahomensis C6786]MBI0359175.1 replication initiation protein [Burkholderia oklahomensis]SUW57997.1 Replicase family [Burkholderia oklahomensis]
MDTSAIFLDRLPHRPYCTNELDKGLVVRPAATALTHRFIQPNAPLEITWLVFDVDKKDAAYLWELRNLPAPTIAVTNRVNRHAHLFYGLTTPIVKSAAARDAPLRYAAAVQAAFCAKLPSDLGYSHLIAKNPFHSHWQTIWHHRLYELGELAEYVNLRKSPVRLDAPLVGLGRNCTLFDEVRTWAYQWTREYKRNGASPTEWATALLGKAESLNTFEVPLPYSEVKSIARSIARWTWRRFTDEAFSAIQAARGQRGGRPRTTTRNGQPWVTAGISRATYYRRLKATAGQFELC